MNSVTIMGTFQKIKMWDGQFPSGNMTITDKKSRKQDDGTYKNTTDASFDVHIFGKQAETINKLFKNGQPICVIAEVTGIGGFSTKTGEHVPQIKCEFMGFGFMPRDWSKENEAKNNAAPADDVEELDFGGRE